MTLTDTGPFVALQDRDDPSHSRCVAAFSRVSAPLLTTLPVLTESMYMLGKRAGWSAQKRLWQMINSGRVQVAAIEGETLARMFVLVERYADVPMDFADASLLAAAEQRDLRRIFTLDSHFRAYRLRNGRALQVIPDES